MANTPKMTPNEAYECKRLMYEGEKYADLQVTYGLSYQTVVGIKAGRFYGSVPWPDGSIGSMPKAPRNEYNKQGTVKTVITGGVNAEQERPIATRAQIDELNTMARGMGFANIGAMLEHNKHIAIVERMAREVEQQRVRTAEYEESESIRMLPENVEARRIAALANPPERQDICDPEVQDKYTWDEILELADRIPIVQVANTSEDFALREAIQIAFKLFKSSQWPQDYILATVYAIRKKIEKYWDEHSEKRPEGEQTAL